MLPLHRVYVLGDSLSSWVLSMLPVTDPGENRRIQTALRQRRTEMVRETLIGRGGRDTATTVLPKTVRGDRKRENTLPITVRGGQT